MDRYSFELDDITDMRIMQLQCSYCRDEPKTRTALVYHGHMYEDENTQRDVVGVFCQGDLECDGNAWAFPVDEDAAILRKHNNLESLNTDN